MKNDYWLVSTEHMSDRLWFRDNEDYKTGMNYVGVGTTLFDLDILAFVLMSNHVHFVFAGKESYAIDFLERFKAIYSQYVRRKYDLAGLLRRNALNIQKLHLGEESLERALAYVQMNPVAARICLHPTAYPWGTGDSFFRVNPPQGKQVGDISIRQRIKLFHSRISLPSSYIIDPGGFINPHSYVPVKFVESIYRTPSRMNYFLQNSSKARLLKEAPSFNDQLVSMAIKDLTVSLFRQAAFSELSPEHAAEVLRQVRYRFSADPKQIARVSGLSYEKVIELLDKI